MSDIELINLQSNFLNLIHQTATAILNVTLVVSLFSPIIVTPIYISVFRSNRVRDQATPVYPITYYFYKMVWTFYSAIVFMILMYCSAFDNYAAGPPLLLALHLVHVHHVLIALLAIQRFILYLFSNLEKCVSFGFKTTSKIIYFIHFLCILPFPASLLINMFIGVIHGNLYDMQDAFDLIFITYNTCLNCIVITSALLYIPIQISIFRLRHLPSIEKQKPHKYILYQSIIMVCLKIVEALSISTIFNNTQITLSITDIFFTPLLVQIPYLFCNRRNVKALRKRLSLKYLWSKLRHRNNRVGRIDNSNNQVAVSYIQSTNS